MRYVSKAPSLIKIRSTKITAIFLGEILFHFKINFSIQWM